MIASRPAVNILHSYQHELFVPHFFPHRDKFDVFENSRDDRVWDVVIVFEGIAEAEKLRVVGNNVVFISGEPPEIGNHAKVFLRQFDKVFCAGAPMDAAATVSGEQHYNNWHFGYSRQQGYRYDHQFIADLPVPQKNLHLSTITSNLNYLPMHIKRRRLIERLEKDYGNRIDIFGRPHRYIEYKEDAIIPYRFHLCIENCSVPDLWTEKIADSILCYSVPVYAGCSNIEKYFPGATIRIDLDDYASARKTVDMILAEGDTIYRERLPAIIEARRKLIEDFDISALVKMLLAVPTSGEVRVTTLKPEAAFPMAGIRDLFSRTRRKISTLIWRQRVAWRG